MNKPSSTITAASLAGMAMALFWEVFQQVLPDVDVRATLIALSVTFVSSVVGYLKREKVLYGITPQRERK